VALKNDGSVLAWGDNQTGQSAVPPEAQSEVVAIAAERFAFPNTSRAYTVALKSDGSVVAWGYNSADQMKMPADLPPVFAIAARASQTFALVRDPPPSLTLFRNADQTLSLSWTGAGTLEETESLTPPNWQPAPSQANPHTINTTGPMKFFRVKAN
jgi:hypothetical protein